MPPKIVSPEPRQAHFIRAWREFRGITQQQFADQLGTSKQSVSRIESGEQPYTQDSLEAIAIYLRCSTSDLLHRSPDRSVDEWSIFDLAPENRERAKDIIKALKASEHVRPAPDLDASLKRKRTRAKIVSKP